MFINEQHSNSLKKVKFLFARDHKTAGISNPGSLAPEQVLFPLLRKPHLYLMLSNSQSAPQLQGNLTQVWISQIRHFPNILECGFKQPGLVGEVLD